MPSTLEKLTNLLKKDERLLADGNLAKNKIIELALQLDKTLLKLLLSSPETKQIFFQEIDNILVFDKIKFQNFISNKQFLPDSFTQYKNKIGLIADRQYLANSAPDEIDRLLTPKVLTNFQKYDCGKEVLMTDISLNDNLIIKGNNLLSLYSLKERYQGKIKLIYIDPPYNPDSKSNTFVYNNGFNESTWLTFMKNRLEVAKKLLTKDGCLIVAIDKNEQAELTVLLKEIFRNYEIHVITIVHNPEGTQAVGFSYTHDFGRDDSVRSANNSCFYPIIVENEKIIGFGEVLDEGEHPEKPIIEKENKLYFEWKKADMTRGVGNDKNAIILDFFGGSGTTAHAVLELNKQDGGNRKFILCEQMDYIETVTRERVRKVCENDQKEQMKKIAFLSYQLEPKNIDNTKSDFTELSFENQRKFLIPLLDKNLLYVPYCDMEDKSYGISEEDIYIKSIEESGLSKER
ncbi:6468_t:CDS:2, partial [Funneliformis geosporum]